MPGSVIITGASGGIGSVVTRELSAQGRHIVMACRDAAKAEKIRQEILRAVPQAGIEILPLDLGSLGSVRQFADAFGDRPVSALFHNAGVISRGYSLTPDGFENTFCVNYFAPFLLTQLLLPRLQADARVVCMVSLTCRFAQVDEASLRPVEKDFSQLGTYARSKLALLHFSQELARRHPGLRVNLADPGIVNSNMISLGRWFDPLADVLFRPFIKSPQQGAVPALAALASPEGGGYFAGHRRTPVAERFRDPALSLRLWEETERLL